MRRLLTVLFVCALPSLAEAQSADAVQRPTLPPAALWASLTLGPGHASNRSGTRIGGQLGAFGSAGPWLAAYRRGGASGIESGGVYDDALLVGRRFPGTYATTYAALGPAKLYDESTGLGVIGVGFAAEAGANMRAIGIGITTFGAVARDRSYIALGLTLDAGWIR